MATARLPIRFGRLLPGLLLALGVVVAGDGLAASPKRWPVAPAGPCAEAMARNPCPAGVCTASTPARSRFDPVDVATEAPGGWDLPNPAASSFAGPGSCADPGTPCGNFEPTRLVGQPPAVVEPPVSPGTLPGLP